MPGRPMLYSVLSPGQSFSNYGLTLRFASIDKATSSAKLSLCAPAPLRVTTSKPARAANGTYPPLVLRGGACSSGKTFRAALTLLVANPSVGCAPVNFPSIAVWHHDEDYSSDDDLRYIPGYDAPCPLPPGDSPNLPLLVLFPQEHRSSACTMQSVFLCVVCVHPCDRACLCAQGRVHEQQL